MSVKKFAPGQRAWHRQFGWGTIETPVSPKGNLLFTSDHTHIRLYHAGKGWIDYSGEDGGKIKHIHLRESELFLTEQKDRTQGLINMLKHVIE